MGNGKMGIQQKIPVDLYKYMKIEGDHSSLAQKRVEGGEGVEVQQSQRISLRRPEEPGTKCGSGLVGSESREGSTGVTADSWTSRRSIGTDFSGREIAFLTPEQGSKPWPLLCPHT